VDGGRFAIKRTVGERVQVEADIFTDGHGALAGELLYRHEHDREWSTAPLEAQDNDAWRGAFAVERLGTYLFAVRAWTDHFGSWRDEFEKKRAAGVDVPVSLRIGAGLVQEAAARAERTETGSADAIALREQAVLLLGPDPTAAGHAELLRSPSLATLVERHAGREEAVTSETLRVRVDRERARFSTWYELFPRSWGDRPGRHATFAEAERALAYVAGMGFDVLYLPPIHPVGHTKRKGRNNRPQAGPDDPGSPWAIGSQAGGHKAVEPQLGTLADFDRFVARAREHGLEVALDLALQCSPDHSYVREHPEWFRWRPDGTVQFAENPPKQYQDIYPFDFGTPGWRSLWDEVLNIVRFWSGHGVRIFRVDNPHTKPFALWDWLIEEVKRTDPDVLFLAEAFTRPKVMQRLAKLGFDQSYTYFTWRTAKWEIEQYFTELTQPPVRDYMRANLWPNTPDILPELLQTGGRPAFVARLVLAATLGANYGIYGPAFELLEATPRGPLSEEYLDSEKYEIKAWPLESADSLRGLITRVNRIRRENQALQNDARLRFHATSNEWILCYSKSTEDGENVILTVVNLDPHHTQSGHVHLPLPALGLEPAHSFQVHDLLTDARYVWQGPHNFVQLDPHVAPAHILLVRHHLRTEQDFDYYR